MIDTNVRHNISIRGTTGRVVVGNKGCHADPSVGNNLRVVGSKGAVAICYMHIRNNLRVSGATGPRIGIFHNTVRGNVQLFGNHVSIATRLWDNSAHQFLCKSNTPRPSGHDNHGVLRG